MVRQTQRKGEIIKSKGETLFPYPPLCNVLNNSLSSNLSTLTKALTYSARAEGLECNDG